MTQHILIEPIQAHKLMGKLWLDIKNKLMAGHKQVIELRDYDDKLTDQQRKYYHSYVLNEIAKQTRVDGKQFGLAVWKEHFRKHYLGDKIEEFTDPMTGATYKEVVRVSTEDLGVTRYNKLIEQVTNFAAKELGVNYFEDFDSWIEENSI